MKMIDIIQKYNISTASYYRIVNNKSQISNNKSNLDINKSNLDNLDLAIENQEEKSISEKSNSFNHNDFMNNLNNNESILSDKLEEKEESIIIEPKIIKQFVVKQKSNNVNLDLSNNNMTFQKELDNNNKQNSIFETIKNVHSDKDDLQTIKEKRNKIIVINQFIQAFPKELFNIYNPKLIFEKKLYTLNLQQLDLILENIRVKIQLSRNQNTFMNGAEYVVRAGEQISCYSGYDVKGLTDDLMNDNEFKTDLLIISCEINTSAYINTKTSALLKIMKKAYMKNKINTVESKINIFSNNATLLEKMKNLDK